MGSPAGADPAPRLTRGGGVARGCGHAASTSSSSFSSSVLHLLLPVISRDSVGRACGVRMVYVCGVWPAFAFVSDPWEPVRCVTVFVAHGACRRGLERHCGDNTDSKTTKK